ncbi:MAG: ATP-binding protein [Gammaproteobacteria bacterium]|nr:ATP-binding protein [Gammaproteobacteria bacterium]MCW8987451.1 ATP-binding protein [Gammaproteobacteria bacterium]
MRYNMGRLFWKIFFGFWLTMLVIGTLVGALIWQHNKERIEQLEMLADSPRAEFNVTELSRILHKEGQAGLEKAIERYKIVNRRPLAVLIVDDAGKDLFNRPVPRLMLDQARKAATDPKQSSIQFVTTPKGEKFLLFIPRRHYRKSQHLNWFPRHLPSTPLLVVFLGSLLFSAGLAWYITRPIRYLREATNEFAKGRLDTRVMQNIGNRKDEITDLAIDFDNMAEQVQQLINVQKRLLNDVSHEIRSPLARLQVAIEMVRQQPDKTETLIQRIEKESLRLDDLVGNLLTLSRLEADVHNNENDYFDINGLITSIADDARFEAESQNKQVVFNSKNEILVNGSMELLRRAIENIIRNAIFYTPEKTQVDITLYQESNIIIITVCDSGEGISEEKLKDLFQPFVRINDTKQNVKIPGYGLGLAIARRAIEIHKGNIKAYNHQNGGLCIEMRLPA